MTNNLKTQLQSFGLSKTETSIYLFLLKEGLASPPRIAEGTGIARTNTYNVLVSLSEKGLIDEQKQGSRKAYLAKDPAAFLERLSSQRESIEQILPDLRALHTTQKNKPAIQFFNGWDEVKTIYEKTYDADEVFAIGSTKRLVELDEAFFRSFEKNLQKKQIVLHDILTPSSRNVAEGTTKPIMKGYYDQVYLPTEFGDPKTDILVWGDNVALISLQDPIFGTVITNGAIAESLKLLAKTLMSRLRE
ncbi:hypothetical protein HQ524_03655 [Candidatus Uhrbacteria bacterium]|nr:hypothetical protein [Candidatus Uhrbacteria bacterium]